MSSLFKRASLPLLAATAACALTAFSCVPARAATATWDPFNHPVSAPSTVQMAVDCNITGPYTMFNTATFYAQLLGGSNYALNEQLNVDIQGGMGNDYVVPQDYLIGYSAINHGTYNFWCICSGGNSGGAWYASTGGTTYASL